jgi:hypothetical protein
MIRLLSADHLHFSRHPARSAHAKPPEPNGRQRSLLVKLVSKLIEGQNLSNIGTLVAEVNI